MSHTSDMNSSISILFDLQSFQQKFFHSKEIIAISCSWCKQAVSVVWGGRWHCYRLRGSCVYQVLTPVSDALLLSSTTRWRVSCCNRSRNLALWAHTPGSLYLLLGLLKSGSHRYGRPRVTESLYIVCFETERSPVFVRHVFVGNVVKKNKPDAPACKREVRLRLRSVKSSTAWSCLLQLVLNVLLFDITKPSGFICTVCSLYHYMLPVKKGLLHLPHF